MSRRYFIVLGEVMALLFVFSNLSFSRDEIVLAAGYVRCNDNDVGRISSEMRSSAIWGLISSELVEFADRPKLNVKIDDEPITELIEASSVIVRVSGFTADQDKYLKRGVIERYVRLRCNGFSSLLARDLLSSDTGVKWWDYKLRENLLSSQSGVPDWAKGVFNIPEGAKVFGIRDGDLFRYLVVSRGEVMGDMAFDARNLDQGENSLFSACFRKAVSSCGDAGSLDKGGMNQVGKWLFANHGIFWINPFEIPSIDTH